ncbi:DUF58 domain-containing protein [Halovivax limisalsi]|uniref:DUF58 domain-containing protein n=1 Tax=Halovivax limisalsi TaxID=1453760 RepID=UPI001FFDC4DE|nr:DUF58 domain-containing protein [Halovivax limisalsi]
MRPTRRGLAVLVTIGAVLALSAQWGPRSLNAVVAPLVVVTVAGAGSVALVDRPTVRRRPVGAGYVGETRPVTVDVESDRGVTATLSDEIGAGLDASTNRFERVLDGETTITYSVRLLARGERSVGPLSISVTDLFGLFSREYTVDGRGSILVYPPVYELTPAARRRLSEYANTAREFDRAVFDRLREYQRGDTLRDVHWKSAAKRPDGELVVKEFVADDGLDRVTLVAAGAAGDGDDLAAATATLVDHLLDHDVGVVLVLPGVELTVTPDRRDEAFRALALFEAGSTDPDRVAAGDIVVEAGPDGIVVDFDGESVAFERLCQYATEGGESPPATDRATDSRRGRARPSTGVSHE